ncbi:MAG: LysR family transcriptional regulator [Betaproteobacteria bacterium]|nr:LysR family transcriptional regulator [Betaproteobacteria bacterium]
MDFRKVQFFLTAVRCGSLTEAADELGVTQPALSKAIKALERSLGVPLVERGRFGVVATPFGEALRYHGQVVEAEFRHAAGEIEALKGAQRGHVIIGCGPTEATRLLPQALKLMQERRPQLRVSVLYGLNESLMPAVKQGEIDFALSSVPTRAQDTDLLHETLFTESAVMVARADHPLARLRQIAPALLAQQQWVLPRQRELERQAFDDFFRGHGLNPPSAQIETTSTVLMKSMVMQSDALTFLPRELIYWEVRSRQLRALPVAGVEWVRPVGMTRRSQGALSPASRFVMECLRSVAAQHF